MTRNAALLMLIALWFGAGTPDAHAAGAMRCEGRIIKEGSLEIEVLGACGEPAYRDAWRQRLPRRDVYVTDAEEWYYNFGSNQLLQVVRLRDGKVVNIDTDGYGFDPAYQPGCNPLEIVPGMSKYRLVSRCGEPATRKASSVLAALRDDDGAIYPGYEHALVPVFREEWVYNFGSSYLLRIVTLENGRVRNVENGNRGF